jgi:hypothetical protein
VVGALAQWNLLWEAAQFRRRIFDEDELPPAIRAVADRGDHNVIFVPRTRSRYYEYLPLVRHRRCCPLTAAHAAPGRRR